MARIRDTVLFKETKDYVKPVLTLKEYEHELAVARKKLTDEHFRHQYKSLEMAFLWVDTPQGHDYWHALSFIVNRNRGRFND